MPVSDDPVVASVLRLRTSWSAGLASFSNPIDASFGWPAVSVCAQVPELLGACAPATVRLELDLTELVSADAAGIEALQRLRDQGATVVGAPGYLQLKLDSTVDDRPKSCPRSAARRVTSSQPRPQFDRQSTVV